MCEGGGRAGWRSSDGQTQGHRLPREVGEERTQLEGGEVAYIKQ